MKSIQSAITIGELVQHFRQRELRTELAWRTFSTRNSYEGNLRKWIVPRWNEHPTKTLKAGEVELWLRSLPLARASCAKLRNLMSMLFNHGVRHGICDANPIRLVRQGAKRKKIPIVLTSDELRRLIEALPLRERTLVLMAAGTGLRISELFALKWSDVHFDRREISVILNRLSSRWSMQNGGLAETHSDGRLFNRSSRSMAGPIPLPRRQRLGVREC
jgi:integrase